MYRYIVNRVLMMIPVIIGVTFLIFFMMDLAPGDATDVVAMEYSEEALQQLREDLHLDEPLLVRYFIYMKDLLRGDLGYSYMSQVHVWDLYVQRFPYTLVLAVSSVLLGVVLSIPLGILAAKKNGSLTDNACTVAAMFGLSVPNFWFGLLLILLFSKILGWFPSYGADEGWKSLVLPAITVGIDTMAALVRTTRSSMLDVLRADYLRTARAKGVDERVVINKHGLRNALIPIITVFGGQLGGAFGGAVITENVFTWPGLGQSLVAGIKARDTTLVCGFIIMFVIMISVTQLLVDLAYAFVDPRIKSQYASGKTKKRAQKGGVQA
ncbi:MAG: ABC transporter permease [Ruminococcaceae bacterium]|nr:ABC transporter permease [Oscillospiraceae bacterium]